MKNSQEMILQERISRAIHVVRNQKTMMDSDLAEMYGVETKVLNQAVKRNLDRFPEDFMFQLTVEEWEGLKAEFEEQKGRDFLRSQIVTLEDGRGRHRKYLPYVFTEQGVAMLSSVLNSPTAIQVNISIMRVFVKMRQWATNYEGLVKRIEELSQNQSEHNEHIRNIYQIIEELIRPGYSERNRIGFK
ncbi:ORF6N domain-containing protein [Mariniradius saccharolyticus]|uniref:ORF6N domain-containing protein n=1 Tax=Mariniradius saccharolyticus TaxID=1245591 RepID=UPI000A3054C0|nr:ORF6N domain-containing protein [Mariniradius saccharolyticus]